jgi:hypothetical protein
MSNWRERLQKQKDADKIKADEDRIKQFQVNDISFPSLGSSNCWGSPSVLPPLHEEEAPTPTPKPTFATLAKTWNEKIEDDRLREETRKAEDLASRNEHSEFRSSLFYRNTLGYSRSHAEDTYYEEEEEDQYEEPTADTSDGWRTTEKKIRQRRTTVDRPVFDPPPVEESSVWDHGADDHY